MLGVYIGIRPPEPPGREIAWAGIAVGWVLLTAYGAYAVRLNWFVDSLNRVKSDGIVLTFDDGPDPVVTPRVLSVLNEKGVKATFFLIGEKAAAYPGLVRRIVAEGHHIGNHSFSHSRQIGFFSRKRLKEDLLEGNRVLEEISGRPVSIFRPPFGVTNPRYRQVLRELDMISVGWSLRSYDTVTGDEKKLLRRLCRKVKAGQIVLLHDTVPETARILSLFIDYCGARQLMVKGLPV